MSTDKVIEEIKLQIEACNAKLEKEKSVSNYVKILSEKRHLEQLLSQEQNKHG